MATPVNFTRPAAERISRVVRLVEGGSRDSGGPSIDRPWGDEYAARRVFRVCTFTGSWSKNTPHVVTFYGVTNTPNTVTATNLFVDLSQCGTSTSANCAIARDGTAWYVIAAECC